MNFIEKHLTSFISNTLKVVFILILIGSILASIILSKMVFHNNVGYFILTNTTLTILTLAIGYLFYRYLKSSKNYTNALLIILSLAFLARILWIFAVNTQPFSDFGLMFECGGHFAKGSYWIFKGTSYIGRFTHLTAFTIYLGLIQKYFANALLIVKIINVILSTLNIYLIYLISNELFDNKEKALWVSLISCLFPPFIVYNSVICSENLAMPFFLASIYLFILVVKSKKSPIWLLFAGAVLSIGNIFRSVGIVILIAYILYLIIYCNRKKVISSCSLILISFIIPLYMVSSILISAGITEYPLWQGREPAITSVLKGTNIEANGMWNKEDSEIPTKYNFDYKAIEKASKDIIRERLTKTPIHKLVIFYTRKFVTQWSVGDFSSLYWSTTKVSKENAASQLSRFATPYSQIYYIVIIAFALLGLFNKEYRTKNKVINLFYIIFCGYGLFYLLTEMQARYAYIASWIFPILSYTGTLLLLEKWKKQKAVTSNQNAPQPVHLHLN
ncbi:glycosyltransferase family 39 protein [Acetivibrio cellulolyticus]|uniref:glycosyltransferase family 39 protein n=1 Tax=Acetivibrio cellulolyticus TaxID=35830 RepID=UPI0001E2FAF1|nr:glycosyltransferase family 39 protein [Acetivibrio cellulolyticus]